jgi:hypothetical protein
LSRNPRSKSSGVAPTKRAGAGRVPDERAKEILQLAQDLLKKRLEGNLKQLKELKNVVLFSPAQQVVIDRLGGVLGEWVPFNELQEELEHRGSLSARGESARTGALRVLKVVAKKLESTAFRLDRVRGRGVRLRPFSTSDHLFRRIVEDGESFWLAHKLFMEREITRTDIRRLLALGLERVGGGYEDVARLFNMGTPSEDYKQFRKFLQTYELDIDQKAVPETIESPQFVAPRKRSKESKPLAASAVFRRRDR